MQARAKPRLCSIATTTTIHHPYEQVPFAPSRWNPASAKLTPRTRNSLPPSHTLPNLDNTGSNLAPAIADPSMHEPFHFHSFVALITRADLSGTVQKQDLSDRQMEIENLRATYVDSIISTAKYQILLLDETRPRATRMDLHSSAYSWRQIVHPQAVPIAAGVALE